jgi:FkbM family methyltransferase
MELISWETVEKAVDEKALEYRRVEDNLDKGIGLYGAGSFGQLMLDYMNDGNYNINCYLDSNKKLHGQKIHGIEVKNLEDFSDGAILITARKYIADIRKMINNAYPVMAFEAWFAVKNISKYKQLRNEVLADEESKHVLDVILYEMLTNNDVHFSEIYSSEQYFCLKGFAEDSDGASNEYFVDVGAYTGDTVEQFIWKTLGNFNKIYAFEPMAKQYNAMVKRVDRLIEEWGCGSGMINLIKAGVGDIESNIEVPIEEGRTSSSTNLDNAVYSEKTECIPIYSLDGYFGNIRPSHPVTFIKADIEGFELRMLKGAENTIKQNKPKLAICVYHKLNDIFDFVEYLSGIVPEYKFRLRHHSRILTETVLYCSVF